MCEDRQGSFGGMSELPWLTRHFYFWNVQNTFSLIADFVTLRGQKCCVIKFRPIYIFIQAVQIENMYSCYTVPTRVTGAIGPQYQIEIFLGFLVLVEFLVVERISEHLNNFFPDKCFVDKCMRKIFQFSTWFCPSVLKSHLWSRLTGCFVDVEDLNRIFSWN